MHDGLQALYRYLLRHSQCQGGKRFLWQYLKKIAGALGVCVRTVQRRMRRLEEMGWIRIEPTFFRHGGRAANRYILLAEPDRGGEARFTYQGMIARLGDWIDELLSGYWLSEAQLRELDRRLRRMGPMSLEAWRGAIEGLLDELV